MTAQAGLSAANLIAPLLAAFRGSTFTIGATYAELHAAVPGANGTTALSAACATRWPVTFASPSGNAIALSGNPPVFLNNNITGETVAYLAIWSAAVNGSFYWSAPLTAPVTWNGNDTLGIDTLGLSFGPVATSGQAGFSSANLIDPLLDAFVGYGIPATTFTLAGTFAQLHTGIPGASGTSAVSVGSTTRHPVAFSAPSNNTIALSGAAPSWLNGGTTETIEYLSIWSAATGGVFLWSVPLSSPVTWSSTQHMTLNTLSVSLGPVATST
jgi:hypothetical protein